MNARTVKKHLTEAGYDVRKIRVRVESRGYSDTYIKVKLFDLGLPLEEIKDFLMDKYEDVSYDFDGEILQGCNTFVTVSYDWDTREAAINSKMEEAQELLDSLPAYNCREGEGKLFRELNNKKLFIFPREKIMSVHHENRPSGVYPYTRYLVGTQREMAEFLVILQQWEGWTA